MAKQNSLIEILIDTIIVLAGFCLVIFAAIEFFLTSDPANLIIFLLGLIAVCIGMGRRMKNSMYWK